MVTYTDIEWSARQTHPVVVFFFVFFFKLVFVLYSNLCNWQFLLFFIYPSDSSKSQSQSLHLLLSISICDQVTSLVMVSDLFFFFFSMITLIATFPSVFIDFLQRGSDQTTDLCLYGSVFFFFFFCFIGKFWIQSFHLLSFSDLNCEKLYRFLPQSAAD